MRTRAFAVPAAVAMLISGLLATGEARQSNGERITYTALAVNLSTGSVPGRATDRVDVTIDRFSTPEEREQLRVALIEQGEDALFKQLRGMEPVGRIRVNDGVGWDLRYAAEVNEGGKRRIVFATDRPVGIAEAWRHPRSLDYRLMIGELRVGPDGEGEGQLSPAARVSYERGLRLIEVETLASQPIRLLQVRPLG